MCGRTWSHGGLSFALQDDLAVVVHGRQHALLKEDHAVLLQTKVVMFGEKILCGFHCPAARHDVPEGNTERTQHLCILNNLTIVQCCRKHLHHLVQKLNSKGDVSLNQQYNT